MICYSSFSAQWNYCQIGFKLWFRIFDGTLVHKYKTLHRQLSFFYSVTNFGLLILFFRYVKRCVFLCKHGSSSKDSPYIAVFFSWKSKWYTIFCLREAYNILFRSNNSVNFSPSFSRNVTLFLFESLTTTADQHCENISF